MLDAAKKSREAEKRALTEAPRALRETTLAQAKEWKSVFGSGAEAKGTSTQGDGTDAVDLPKKRERKRKAETQDNEQVKKVKKASNTAPKKDGAKGEFQTAPKPRGRPPGSKNKRKK